MFASKFDTKINLLTDYKRSSIELILRENREKINI